MRTCPEKWEHVRKNEDVSGKIRTCPKKLGHVRKNEDVSGKMRTCPEKWGRVRKNEDMSGKMRTCPEKWGRVVALALGIDTLDPNVSADDDTYATLRRKDSQQRERTICRSATLISLIKPLYAAETLAPVFQSALLKCLILWPVVLTTRTEV
jgi:hypothetical protein